MVEIFHVSDLHFRTGLFAWFHNRKAKYLLNKISIDFRSGEDKYLLVTGDFTQSGDKDEYKTAMKALQPFTGRIFMTPGNHDYGPLFGTGYEKKKVKYFDDPFAESLGFSHHFFDKKVYYRELKDSDGRIILILAGLNSCSKTGLHDFAQGEIGSGQLKELKDILDKSNPDIPKLVFLHHIPYRDPEWKEIMVLRDWEKLMNVLRNRVSILAFGHQGKDLVVVSDEVSKFVSAEPRPMQLRYLRQDNTTYLILDANDSVKKRSCYHITIDSGKLNVNVKRWRK